MRIQTIRWRWRLAGLGVLAAGLFGLLAWFLIVPSPGISTVLVPVDKQADQCNQVVLIDDGTRIHVLGRVHTKPDTQRLVVWHGEAMARLLVLGNNFPTVQHGVPRRGLAPDGKFVLTSESPVLQAWNTATGKLAWQSSEPARFIRFLSGQRVCVERDNGLEICELETGKSLLRFPQARMYLPGNLHRSGFDLYLPPDRQELWIVGQEWDSQFKQHLDDRVAIHKLGADGSRAIVKLEKPPSVKLQFTPGRTRFTPDGQYVVSGYGYWHHTDNFILPSKSTLLDPYLRIWNSKTGEMVHESRHDGPVRLAVPSPDGRQLLTVVDSKSFRIALQDLPSGRKRWEYTAELMAVDDAAFSGDGRRAAVLARDKHGRTVVQLLE